MKTRKYTEQEMIFFVLFAKNNYNMCVVDKTEENTILKYSFYQDSRYNCFLKITRRINNVESKYSFHFLLSKSDYEKLKTKYQNANI